MREEVGTMGRVGVGVLKSSLPACEDPGPGLQPGRESGQPFWDQGLTPCPHPTTGSWSCHLCLRHLKEKASAYITLT